jgi:hypothetical protein
MWWGKEGREQNACGLFWNCSTENPERHAETEGSKKFAQRGNLSALPIVAQTAIRAEGNVAQGFLWVVMTMMALICERAGGAGFDCACRPQPDTASAVPLGRERQTGSGK